MASSDSMSLTNGVYRIYNAKYGDALTGQKSFDDYGDYHTTSIRETSEQALRRWHVRKQGDGTYKFHNSGLKGGPLFCGDSTDAVGDHTTWVEPRKTYENDGKERWRVEAQEDGTFKLFNAKWAGPLFCGDTASGGGRGIGVESRESSESGGQERWFIEACPNFTPTTRSSSSSIQSDDLSDEELSSDLDLQHCEVPCAGLTTTVIGAFPKPDYVGIVDWFKTGLGGGSGAATAKYTEMLSQQTAEQTAQHETNVLLATKEVVEFQTRCGVEVVTDGEVRRENYIHYFCRFIEGIDFTNLTETSCRGGAYSVALPTIRGKISWRGPLDCAEEWRKAQDRSAVPVKYTLPGPMTIMGTLCNAYYGDERDLAADLSVMVNRQVRLLVAAGCRAIQIDEPLFCREPQKALAWGIAMLDRCFESVDGSACQRQVHMCCGYPEYLDQEGYQKADIDTYFRLAPAIDACCVDAVSIEDAHRNNDLTLLEFFKHTKVILGVVKVANSKVESVGEIETRLREALEHIDADRLIVAPDCGLGLLPLTLIERKLSNMCTAARRVGMGCACAERPDPM